MFVCQVVILLSNCTVKDENVMKLLSSNKDDPCHEDSPLHFLKSALHVPHCLVSPHSVSSKVFCCFYLPGFFLIRLQGSSDQISELHVHCPP